MTTPRCTQLSGDLEGQRSDALEKRVEDWTAGGGRRRTRCERTTRTHCSHQRPAFASGFQQRGEDRLRGEIVDAAGLDAAQHRFDELVTELASELGSHDVADRGVVADFHSHRRVFIALGVESSPPREPRDGA
jgi:hypothetical protein